MLSEISEKDKYYDSSYMWILKKKKKFIEAENRLVGCQRRGGVGKWGMHTKKREKDRGTDRPPREGTALGRERQRLE